jgi:hypothetical protein
MILMLSTLARRVSSGRLCVLKALGDADAARQPGCAVTMKALTLLVAVVSPGRLCEPVASANTSSPLGSAVITPAGWACGDDDSLCVLLVPLAAVYLGRL